MKTSKSFELYRELFVRVVEMDIKAYSAHLLTKKSLRKLLAPVIIGCKYNGESAIETTTQYPEDIVFHQKMQDGLNKLLPFKVGQKTQCGNRVGACAENVSGNAVLWRVDASNRPIPELNDLEFTVALRPRTFRHVNTCDNCLTVFND